MKKTIIFLFALMLVTTSCSKLDKLTQFEIKQSVDFEIPVPAGGINLPFDIPTPDIESTLSKDLENNNSNKDLIEKIYLKEFNMVIENPSSQTFSFLKNIDIFIKADGLPKLKIAYKHDIDNSIGQDLVLDIVDQDLQAYLKKDNYSMDITTTIDEIITNKVELRADLKFWVDAKILGL